MFVIFLKLAENRQLADAHLAAHHDWIRQGVDDEAFLLVGSLSGGQGGAIIAHGVARADIDKRLEADPFVAERIVAPRSSRSTPAWSTTASPS